MQIDFPLSKQAILKTGRTLAGWGRVHGLGRGSVTAILNGRFTSKNPDRGVYAAVIAALAKDGFLVTISETDDGQNKSA